jgi:opacity protein-like surface antigen
MNIRIQLGFGIAFLAATFAAFAQAQTWEYRYYKLGPGGQYEKDRFVAGTLSLMDEKDGKGTVRIVAGQGKGNNCTRGDLPAAVTKSDATTTLELQLLTGCDETRYVIRNDGSGGEREIRRNDKWVKDGYEHGLTPVAK